MHDGRRSARVARPAAARASAGQQLRRVLALDGRVQARTRKLVAAPRRMASWLTTKNGRAMSTRWNEVMRATATPRSARPTHPRGCRDGMSSEELQALYVRPSIYASAAHLSTAGTGSASRAMDRSRMAETATRVRFTRARHDQLEAPTSAQQHKTERALQKNATEKTFQKGATIFQDRLASSLPTHDTYSTLVQDLRVNSARYNRRRRDSAVR